MPPATSFNAIPEGAHTLSVRATDALLNVGNPATYDWSVDLTPPTVSIDSSPTSPTASTSGSFTYHSSEANSTYLCSLDAALAAACGGSFSQTVANGDHTFDVWAIDEAGQPERHAGHVRLDRRHDPAGRAHQRRTDRLRQVHERNVHVRLARRGPPRSSATSTARATRRAPRRRPTTGCTAGLHTFYVRGTDALGNKSADKTQAWTVDLADHKPDAQIATGTTYVGNGVYNGTGTSQTKILKTKAGTTVSFKIKIENDGTDTDSYTVNGGGSMKGYTVSYFVGATDYTTKITNGTYTFSLAPGAYKSITMKVKVGSTGKASFSSLIKATSGHEQSKLDAVKGTIKRV